MIDLDELERVVNCFPFDGDLLALSKGECKDLISRLRQAEKDAARYRWLRDYHIGDYPENINLDGRGSLDDAIDEAMQCK